MNIVMGMVEAATSAVRIGSSSITTTTTATMAIINSLRKVVTLAETTSLWSVMRNVVTSCGRVF